MSRVDYRNIETHTKKNRSYRRVIYTGPKNQKGRMQLVLMALAPGEDIPLETHKTISQFIRVEAGRGYALVGRKRYTLRDGISIIIPPGRPHYIKNTSKRHFLKLYSIYTPPEHSASRHNKRQPAS